MFLQATEAKKTWIYYFLSSLKNSKKHESER
eukprot:UN08973